ncbi:PhzF family phenazine biosynthesis protein [Coraliomargarita sp. SDUM461004]|uniref:PhzF family phenazine biosynthesis protein n=1 Tax=Thalassobacterium sedimentorum TaxID=3041258 RepID=A0ABU1AHA6_9BACT|nr:PhzF family phenazine biosynthesis protein [Coraliomargarita sp. SDUM461004]MDQ8193255.1 PhzF family phenazine biosynthesis protein [Coraliomargarita sp. SDUM461004]
MKLPIYQIDAFAPRTFQGNPAAVCPLEAWLPDEILQAIAEENNLAETAFYVEKESAYELRWFTPTKEVDLCGHATLAAAHVIFENNGLNRNEITFHSKSGLLGVTKCGELLELDFPIQAGVPCEPPAALIEGLGKVPSQCFKGMDYMAVYKDEATIRSLSPDFTKLRELNLRGVIVTAPGKSSDFVSRFFAPNFGINEDPVTGSAHCAMTPYWADRLGKSDMMATQLSRRTGQLRCRLSKDRVLIAGKTIAYLKGDIELNRD